MRDVSMNRPLLSIVVPTYNRPKFLDGLLASVATEIRRAPELGALLEIVVSDNASECETEAIVRRWKERLPKTIYYRRNNENLGGPRNLVAAIEDSHGTYSMYMGDDDRLRVGAGVVIRRLLEAKALPLHLFAHSDFLGMNELARGPGYSAVVSVEEAVQGYFFSAGVPGGAAMRTELVRLALARVGRERLALMNWPQTVLAFLAAVESNAQEPVVVQHTAIAHVSEHHSSNTIYTARIMWNTWVQGLVRAAQLLDEVSGKCLLGPACKDIFSPRRLRYPVEKVIEHLLLVDDSGEVTRFAEEMEMSIRSLPDEYQRIPRELLELARMKAWMRVPTLVWRKLGGESIEVPRRPSVFLSRGLSLVRLARYYRHHRRMRREYATGCRKGIRDYSTEGY
jgi:hypothetical protein